MSYFSRKKYRRLNFRNKKTLSPEFSYKLRFIKIILINFLYANSIKIIVGFFLFFTLLFFIYSKDLPTPEKIKRKEGFSIVVYDRNTKPIYDIYTDKNRIPIPLADIPDSLKKATISIEDKDFYKHGGFSSRGILRAMFNIMSFKGLQGGSTLTQQLVKNVLLTSERTLPRKFKEFILAVQIERKYNKDEILQMYLNEAPYGGTMWGIESAAKGYFGKTAKDVNLVESVILAGLPQRPTYYSPFGVYPDAYKERANQVLRRMKEDGYITNIQEQNYKLEIKNFQFNKSSDTLAAPHFIEYIRKQLVDKFGEKKVEEGGLKVTTTLDLELQKKSEEIVIEELNKIKALNATNAAVVAIDPTNGEILAYIGSKEYESEDKNFQGKFDVVSQGLRQPGSALKPITYAAAFSKNYTLSSVIMDVETKFPGGEGNKDYIPKNYDNKFRGPTQLRFALGNSINVPAVKLTALVGIHDILDLAFRMGLSSLEATAENEKRLGLSLTLGGGEVRLIELAYAYGVLANRGIRQEPISILKVIDTNGNTIYENKASSGKKVIGEDISFLISHILLDNNARKDVFGEKSYLTIPGQTVAVKTGTTDDKRDNWTVGYTTNAVVGVWVGNNDNSPMSPKLASGTTGAAPIWNRIFKEILKKRKSVEFNVPENIVSINIDAFAGGIPKDGKPTRSEYYIKGTEPELISPIYKKLKVSKSDSNKLANPIEVLTGSYDEKDYIVFEEIDPTSNDNRWQQGIVEWLKTQSDPMYHPPTELSTKDENSVVVSIKRPQNEERVNSNEFTIRAEGKSSKNVNKLEVFIDGELRDTIGADNFEKTYNALNGFHKIKVKATDSEGRSGESEINIAVNTDFATPTQIIPTPTNIISIIP